MCQPFQQTWFKVWSEKNLDLWWFFFWSVPWSCFTQRHVFVVWGSFWTRHHHLFTDLVKDLRMQLAEHLQDSWSPSARISSEVETKTDGFWNRTDVLRYFKMYVGAVNCWYLSMFLIDLGIPRNMYEIPNVIQKQLHLGDMLLLCAFIFELIESFPSWT